MEFISPRAKHFDLVDLRLFVRVAEAHSLTRGAERSFLSLAAASLRIKNLEEALGTKVFHRTKQGVSPTEAGQVLLSHARTVLRNIEYLQSDMQPYSSGIRGHVRLFANTTAIAEHLPSVLGRFLATHDAISIDLQERLSPEVVRAVHEGVADVGVMSSSVRADGLETLPYKKDRLVIAVPADHPLAEVPYSQFVDVLAYDFVGLDSHSAIHTFLKHEVSALGLGMRLRIQVGSFDAMCRMIEAGVGIGVLPEMAARRHASTARIQIVQLADEWADRELRICLRRQSELPVFARELIDFLSQN